MRSDADGLCSKVGIRRQCRFHGIQSSMPVSEFITTTLTLLTLFTESISSNISCSATCMPQSKAAIDERHFHVLYKLLSSRVVSFGLRIPRFVALDNKLSSLAPCTLSFSCSILISWECYEKVQIFSRRSMISVYHDESNPITIRQQVETRDPYSLAHLLIVRGHNVPTHLCIRPVTRDHIRMASDRSCMTRVLETSLDLPLVADLTKAFRLSGGEV